MRIDVRAIDPVFLGRLTNFAETAECVLVTPTGRVIEPDPYRVRVELELSRHCSSCATPQNSLTGFVGRKRADRKGAQGFLAFNCNAAAV